MLHTLVHGATFFVNLQMQYMPRFKADMEVEKSLMNVMETLVPDRSERALIDVQLDEFTKNLE